ncbi:hypothetical protein CF319_g7795 [Tilletia indica]|nr:hypothetical protein CF319_g7795 [Tilletia indica]
MADTIKEIADIPQSFIREGTQFMNRCTKPNKKEYLQICRAVGLGVVVMGFIGPAIHTDSMTGCLSTPPTPEVVPSTVASSPSAAEASQRADGLFCTRSDTNLPATGVDATVVMPGTPTEGATDYLAAVRLTGSSSISSASPSAMSPSFGPEVSLPQIVLPGIATSSASRPPLSGEIGEGSRHGSSFVKFYAPW